MPSPRNIAVSLGNGLIVMHTLAEWREFTAGVDMDAALKMRTRPDVASDTTARYR